MDKVPIPGRVFLWGDAGLRRAVRALLPRHLDVPPGRVEEVAPGRAGRGDLLLDLTPTGDGFPTCRRRGAVYAGVADRPASAEPGPTAVVGHGARPGLLSHFARVALRDLTVKALRARPDDPRAAECAKLLHAGAFGRLAASAGVVSVVPAAAPDLGVVVLGQGFNAWWTGSLLDDAGADRLVPGGTADEVRTAVAVVAAAVWALRHPDRGVVGPGHLSHEDVLEVALPYLEPCRSFALDGAWI